MAKEDFRELINQYINAFGESPFFVGEPLSRDEAQRILTKCLAKGKPHKPKFEIKKNADY